MATPGCGGSSSTLGTGAVGCGGGSSLRLLALPDDVLTAVCALAPDDLPALRLTCTALLRPANCAVRCLKLRRACSCIQPGRFPCLTDLAIEDGSEGWSDSCLAELAQALSSIESLKLGRLQPLTGAGAAAALALLPRLRRLELAGSTLPGDGALGTLAAALPRELTSLSLRECGALTDAGLAGLLATLPALREADLSMCTQLGDAALAQLGRCTQLAKLDVTGCERFSEAGLRQLAAAPIRTLLASACCQLTDGCLEVIAQGMPHLACLGLFESGEEVTDGGLAHLACLAGSLTALDLGYSCWQHTEQGLAALLGRLPGLCLLNIGGCEGATDAVVSSVAQHCQQLTMLDVSECQRMTAAGVAQLGKLPRLEELSLGWNIRLRDEWLEGLPASLSRLDLSFCGELSDRGLRCLGRLPRLANLVLRKCGRVTDEGLLHLAACTSLTHLDMSHCQHITGLAALRPLRQLASLVLLDCTRALHPPCMALLAELPALRSLEMSGKRVDDGCMQALSHVSHLATLSLSSCPRVSDRGLLALCRARGLRHLNIDCCPQLSGGALEQLQRRLVLLRLARPRGQPTATPLLEY